MSRSDTGDALWQTVGIDHAGAAGGSEIAVSGGVGAFAIFEPVGKLRNQEVKISPALAMCMAALVDEHAVDRGAQVGTVIEIEATQIKLIRFALAAVLAHDQSGRGFQQLAGTIDGSRLQLFLRDHAGICRISDTQLTVSGALDFDSVDLLQGRSTLRTGQQ